MSPVKNVGEKIRKIRELRKLSQEDLALKSNLSKELIVIIEENKDMPFLAPLIRIARSLGVRPAVFLDDAAEVGPVISRSETRRKSGVYAHTREAEESELNFISLASNKSGRHMEPYIIEIKPVIDKDFLLSSHEGEEFIYVLSGGIEISYGKENYTLSVGDSIYFDSIVNHHVHTIDNTSARILAVVYEML